MMTAAEHQAGADTGSWTFAAGRTHLALGGRAPHPLSMSPSLLRLPVGVSEERVTVDP